VENDLVSLLMVAKEGARKEIEDSLVRVH
jgi:hypothetical protein